MSTVRRQLCIAHIRTARILPRYLPLARIQGHHTDQVPEHKFWEDMTKDFKRILLAVLLLLISLIVVS